MAKNCNCNESVVINGIYSTSVDLNTLIKVGRFKVKLGDNRPNNVAKNADALVSVAKHEQCIIQSVLILNGPKAGKTYTRSSFTDGSTWSEYVSSSEPDISGKLNKDFDDLSDRDPLNDDDVFVLWSGEDNFKISASALRKFISGEYFKGYKSRPSCLAQITDPERGDYAIIGSTKSFWMYDGSQWRDTTTVTSVNGRTGDVVISSKDVLGIDKSDILTNLNRIVNALNDTDFLSYYYSGFTDTDSGNIQVIPGLVPTDKVFLILGGITLKQDVDFKITGNNEITIINDISSDVPNTLHIFKAQRFSIPKFTNVLDDGIEDDELDPPEDDEDSDLDNGQDDNDDDVVIGAKK